MHAATSIPSCSQVAYQNIHVLSCMQERQLLRRISFDRNIVQFYGACLESQPPMLVSEYIGGEPPAVSVTTGLMSGVTCEEWPCSSAVCSPISLPEAARCSMPCRWYAEGIIILHYSVCQTEAVSAANGLRSGDLFSALHSSPGGRGASHPLSWRRRGRSVALDVTRGLRVLPALRARGTHARLEPLYARHIVYLKHRKTCTENFSLCWLMRGSAAGAQ